MVLQFSKMGLRCYPSRLSGKWAPLPGLMLGVVDLVAAKRRNRYDYADMPELTSLRSDPIEIYKSITQRQREVMDRVLIHRTSKEIARDLGIHPSTVDQRINAVRSKLQATDRGDAARLYAQLLKICGQTTYEFPHIDSSEADEEYSVSGLPDDPYFTLNDAHAFVPKWDEQDGRPDFLKEIDDKAGKPGRIFLIFVIAISLLVLLLVGLASAEALGKLL